MRRILCFGDSNTYGYSPIDGTHYGDDVNWPGVLNQKLGDDFEVINEGKNGRTIAFDDPYNEGCNGMNDIEECIENNSPLDLVVIMLGTNDLKVYFESNPQDVAGNLRKMCEFVQSKTDAKVLIASPMLLGDQIEFSPLHLEFGRNQVDYSFELGPQFEIVAKDMGVDFIDLAIVAMSSDVDCLHLMPEEHAKVAQAMHDKVLDVFADEIKQEQEEAERARLEEEAEKARLEEEARQKEEEERLRLEEEARLKEEAEKARLEEEARLKAEEEAEKARLEEEARLKAEEEAEEARLEEEARLKAEEEAEKARLEEEARQKEKDDELREIEEAAKRKQEEIFKAAEEEVAKEGLVFEKVDLPDDMGFEKVITEEELNLEDEEPLFDNDMDNGDVENSVAVSDEEPVAEEKKPVAEESSLDGIVIADSPIESAAGTMDYDISADGMLSTGTESSLDSPFMLDEPTFEFSSSAAESSSKRRFTGEEKEKMLAGKLYKCDDELKQAHTDARKLTDEFNCVDTDESKREDILTHLFNRVGIGSYIEPPFRCDYGFNISIGEDFYSNFDCIMLDVGKITIGDHVFFGPRVSLYTASHPIYAPVRNEHLEYCKEIAIGDDVWIGGDVTINPGVHIGSNVVIGSGSVVTRDIPDGVIAAGNPCRIIRKISEEDKKYWEEQKKEYDE